MDLQVPVIVLLLIANVLWFIVGWGKGFTEGKREGLAIGKNSPARECKCALMTSLTKQKTLSKTEAKITAWQLSITFELPNYGQPTLNVTSSLTKSQSVWHLSKSHAYKRQATTQTVTRTAHHTLRSLDRLHQLTGMTLTVIKAAPGVWCDYCKVRFGTNNLLGQKQQVIQLYQTIPEATAYADITAMLALSEVQTWTDGTVWSLPEQTEYLMGQDELPNV